MSGPPYPPSPNPGSNAIGSFQIGISPIGTIPFNPWLTIISQFSNSDVLTTLITNFAQYIDPTQNVDDFFDFIWNVDTAQGYGLDVWGRIVGVSRTIEVPSTQSYFGFEEMPDAGSTFPFDIFFSGSIGTNNFQLSDSAFRVLIFAKALANISDGSIPSINQLLLNLFPNRGDCYVTDGEDMTMTYTFEFGLSAVELVIVQQSGVLPKPVGVAAAVVIV